MEIDFDDPKVKAAIAEQVKIQIADATAEMEEANRLLSTNNKDLTKQLRAARAKADGVNPEEFQKLQEQNEALTTQLKEVQDTMKKEVATLTKERETLTASLQKEQGFTRQLLVDNGLTESLSKVGVESAFMPAVKAFLGSKVSIVEDGENRKAMVGDVPLSDFITKWSGSDEGKVYVKAPANGGGSAPGSTSQGQQIKTIASNDPKAFAENLEGIAKGTVVVAPQSA